MAETSSHPMQPEPQTSVVQPEVVTLQQIGYQSPSGQQPIQYSHVVHPGQSAPIGQQPVNLDRMRKYTCGLKIFEFVCIVAAIALVSYSRRNQMLPYGALVTGSSNMNFFMGILITALILVILLSFSIIFDDLQKICGAPQNFHIVVTLLQVVWALLLVISSGLMANQAAEIAAELSRLKDKSYNWDNKYEMHLFSLYAAVALGFVSFLIFLEGAHDHFKYYSSLKKQGQSGMQGQSGTQQPFMQTNLGVQQPMMQPYQAVQQPMMYAHLGTQQAAMTQAYPEAQQQMMQANPGIPQPVMQEHPGAQHS